MNGVLMNCGSLEAAVASLATAAGRSADELHANVTSIDSRDLERRSDPVRALPELVAERLGCDLGGFTEVRYFHGTRTRDAGSFQRDGILSLGDRLEKIWSELGAVGAEMLSAEHFLALREKIECGGGGGWHYQLKTPALMHHGPFAEYVREHFMRPSDLSAHDYLRTPEIVEDIANAAHVEYGIDLLAAYTAATRACIVSFDQPVADADAEARAIVAACWYVRAAASGEVTRHACGGFDGHGISVAPAAVRDVVFVDR